MSNHLVSVFDVNYLSRAVALYETGTKHIPDCSVWFLCLDDKSKDILERLKLPRLQAVTVEEIGRQELSSLRSSRSRGEFAFTSKSNFLSWLSDTGRFADGDAVIFADADVLFMAPMNAFLEGSMRKYPILRTPHNFPTNKSGREKEVGSYNAGMVFFRMGDESRACIDGWAHKCIEWCFNRYEDGKFADQMYIDHWAELYEGVHDVEEKGINLGTWSLPNYRISSGKDGGFIVDEEPVFCYHFHGLKAYESGDRIKAWPITVYHKGMYSAYLKALEKAYRLIRTVEPGFRDGLDISPGFARSIKQKIQAFFR